MAMTTDYASVEDYAAHQCRSLKPKKSEDWLKTQRNDEHNWIGECGEIDCAAEARCDCNSFDVNGARGPSVDTCREVEEEETIAPDVAPITA